jgi:hypothetical protein
MLRVALICVFVFSLQSAEVRWLHFSTATNHLPLPSTGKLQTASVIGDFDNDKTNDFVLAFADAGPALVLYHRGTNWTTLPIEIEPLPIASGGVAADVDLDNDLDLIFGSATGTEIWWWENPNPVFNADKSWTRRLIRDSGTSTNRGQLMVDLLGSGRPQLVFWNQGTNALFHVAIPSEPRTQSNWVARQLFKPPDGFPAILESINSLDLNIDGNLDLLAGNFWLKGQHGMVFQPTRIGTIPGRSAFGRFRDSTYPQIVIAPQNSRGSVYWYECKTKPELTESWAGRELLSHEIAPAASLAIGDIDKDGNDDIFLSERQLPSETSTPHSPFAWIFYSDGNGNFRPTLFSSDLEISEAKLVDLDNDSDLDILSTPNRFGTPRVDIWLNVTDFKGPPIEPK